MAILGDDGVMDAAFDVAAVRRAEAAAMADVSPDTLMARAAFGLATFCARLLKQQRGAVVGSRIVVLAGSGNNGGDALWAAAMLANRGVAVTAVLLADHWHAEGSAALLRNGGRVEVLDLVTHGPAIGAADLILDGILGIGGAGALRESAATVAALAAASAATVVAVDLPSGMNANTGAIEDAAAVVVAQETVTFGCLKPGLLVSPGAEVAGHVTLIDIGLELAVAGCPTVSRVSGCDAALLLPEPHALDDKYTRGVVGVVAGSLSYPGAGVLCSGAARLGGAGMVRYAGSAADPVISRWPEVVVAADGPARAGRVQAWVVGPGAGTDADARQRIVEALSADAPVILDADALTLVADDRDLRDMIGARHAEKLVTILTPHAGEFTRLGFLLKRGKEADRIGDVRAAAVALGAVVLLKGHATVVAEPGGVAFVNTVSDSCLATAGSGDVLSGLLGSMLAGQCARSESVDEVMAAEVAACASLIHGLAGKHAAASGRPVTSEDVLSFVPNAIADLRQQFTDDAGLGGSDV